MRGGNWENRIALSEIELFRHVYGVEEEVDSEIFVASP